MRVIKHEHQKNVSLHHPFILDVYSDTHFGNPGMKNDLLKAHIKQTKRDKASWIHLGDWCEFITPNDRRFDISNPPPSIIEQQEQAIEAFYPIRKQCIGVLAGNHEEVISRTYGDVMHPITQALDVAYLGFSSFINLRLKASTTRMKSYILYTHHGHGMGALLGAKQINLHRMSHKFGADIYLIGHIHTYMHHIDNYLQIRNSGARHPRLEQIQRQYASCPSYFDPYVLDNGTNYGERGAVYPQPNGKVRMTVSFRDGHKWNVKLEPVLE